MRTGIFATLLALSCLAAKAAGSLEKGEAAFFKGDYATAMQLLRPLADEGDAQAQYFLGFMHEKGLGVPQDYGGAIRWYRLAAESGHPYAQNNLGVLYKNGKGVAKDYVQAYAWFALAASGYLPAELGHRERALLNLEEVASQMSSAQITEAQKLVQEKRSSEPDGVHYRPPRIR